MSGLLLRLAARAMGGRQQARVAPALGAHAGLGSGLDAEVPALEPWVPEQGADDPVTPPPEAAPGPSTAGKSRGQAASLQAGGPSDGHPWADTATTPAQAAASDRGPLGANSPSASRRSSADRPHVAPSAGDGAAAEGTAVEGDAVEGTLAPRPGVLGAPDPSPGFEALVPPPSLLPPLRSGPQPATPAAGERSQAAAMAASSRPDGSGPQARGGWARAVEETTEVHVSIGRIEITALPAPQAPLAGLPRRRPTPGVDDYLARRHGRRP